MPQPDNRRQRGVATQTSQRQVAPQGQMPANISPVSGGAAAAAPVLQIGQQAQIQQTGAELYQFLSAATAGIAQGLQNYEKMYTMQSEADYADFETAYVTEYDRVRGDSEKLKIWMDNQPYKPNRITAKKYQSLRANVNQKAYEEDQLDQWRDDLRVISSMPSYDALKYLDSKIDQYDENSPYARNAFNKITELQGQVAGVARRNNLNGIFLQNREDNVNITAQLKNNLRFAESLSSPAYQMVLALRGIGKATIDPQTGVVTLTDTDTQFDLNSMGDYIPVMQGIIDKTVQSMDPELVSVSYRAANLPETITGRPSSGQPLPLYEITGGLKRALNGANPSEDFRSFLLNDLGSSDKSLDYIQKTSQSIIEDPDLSPLDKARLLDAMTNALEYESAKDMWAELGFDSEEDVKEAIGPFAANIATARDNLVLESIGPLIQAAATQAEGAMTPAQVQYAYSSVFSNQVLPLLATVYDDANILMVDPYSKERRKFSLSEYEDWISTSGTNQLREDGTMPRYIPIGVEVVDRDLSGASKAPLMFAMDDTGHMFRGNGNPNVVRGIEQQLENLTKNMDAAANADAVMRFDSTLDDESRRVGLARIASLDPFRALTILADPRLPETQVTNEEVFNNIYRAVNPTQLTTMIGEAAAIEDPEQRQAAMASIQEAIQDLNTAASKYQSFGDMYKGQGDNPRAADKMGYLGLYGGFIPVDESTTPESFMQNLNQQYALYISNEYTALTSAVTDLGTKLDTGFNKYIATGDVPLSFGAMIGELEESTAASAPYQIAVLSRIQNDYLTFFGGNTIDEDLASDDNKTRFKAQQFYADALKEVTKVSRISMVADPRKIITHINETPISVSNRVPSDPNVLYSTSGSRTAQEDGILALFDFAERTAAENQYNVESIAGAFGFDSEEQLGLFRTYLQTGSRPPKNLEARFRAAKEVLSSVKLNPISTNTDDLSVQVDENGKSYVDIPYQLTWDESIVSQTSGSSSSGFWRVMALSSPVMVPTLLALGLLSDKEKSPGMSQELEESLRGGQAGRAIIVYRRKYLNGSPDNQKTGITIQDERRYVSPNPRETVIGPGIIINP